MKKNYFLTILVAATLGCDNNMQPSNAPNAQPLTVQLASNEQVAPVQTAVKDIPLPKGYRRVTCEDGTFAAWLRQLKLKSDKTVYLFNGQKKPNQTAQYAVLDVSVGKRDCNNVQTRLCVCEASIFMVGKITIKLNFIMWAAPC